MPRRKRPLVPKFLAMSRQERDLLYQLYVERDLSADEIADKYGCSVRFVYVRLDEHGLTKGGATKPQLRYCPTCGQARPRAGKQQ